MENKIGEIVTLPPHDTEARVVAVSNVRCEGCYYQDQEYLCLKYRCDGVLGECWLERRKDQKNIITNHYQKNRNEKDRYQNHQQVRI